MKPGTPIVLKEGLFGQDPPRNVAVFLRARRHKGKALVDVYTYSGFRTLTRSQLKRWTFTLVPYAGSAADIGAMASYLGEVSLALAAGDVARGESKVAIPEAKLAKKLPSDQPLPLDAVASLWFKTPSPSDDQLRRLREALNSMVEQGLEHLCGDPEAGWRALTQGELTVLATDRTTMVAMLHKAEAAMEGKLALLARGLDLTPWGLEESEETLMADLAGVMAEFVASDAWGEGWHIPGVWRTGGVDLRELLGQIATALTGDSQRSNAFAKVLLARGHWDLTDFMMVLAERRLHAGGLSFSTTYPEYLVRQTGKLPDLVEWSGDQERVDLRHLQAYTIDPPDAKDFDDAISILEPGVDGNPTSGLALFVHIADVSHYVVQGTGLDAEARSRATSVYLPGNVLPMLPPKLADDLCSLRAGAPRLAMTCLLELDPVTFAIRDQWVGPSVIEVTENLSYEEFLERAEAGGELEQRWLGVARGLREHRETLDLRTADTKVHLHPSELTLEAKRETPATKMIETYMVTANEAVARFLTDRDVPTPYRAHPPPDLSRLVEFNDMMAALEQAPRIALDHARIKELQLEATALRQRGLRGDSDEDDSMATTIAMLGSAFGGNVTIKGMESPPVREPDPEGSGEETITETPGPRYPPEPELEASREMLRAINGALTTVNGLDERSLQDVLGLAVLRCLSPAFYTTENLGHFGLGSACYAHYTSPIRRYPDLIVHRLIRWVLRNRRQPSGEQGPDGPAGLPLGDLYGSGQTQLPEEEAYPYLEDELEELCEHCTSQAKAAERFEYGLIDASLALSCLLDPGFANSTHPGRVAILFGSRAIVKLESGIEGSLRYSNLRGRKRASVDDTGAFLLVPLDLGGRGKVEDAEDIVMIQGVPMQKILHVGQKVSLRITRFDVVDAEVQLALG